MHAQFQHLGPQAAPPMGQNAFHLVKFNHNGGGGSAGSQLSHGTATVVKVDAQPIHVAVQCGSLRGAKLLIDANPGCVHVLDSDGQGPAWLAARGGHADILRLLIKHHVELNAPTSKSHSYPIHQAAHNGHKKAVELLLRNGADPDPINDDGVTPLWLAAQEGYDEIVAMILEHESTDKKINLEVEWEHNNRRALHQAAQNGHLKAARLLLAKGAAYDPVDTNGATPLWFAAGKDGNADLVRELLKVGAKIDVQAYENRQPIHQAALHGQVEVARVLLDAGANPTPENDGLDDSEPSPFLLACGSGNVELVNLFLDRGADVQMGSGGKSALHFAAEEGVVAVGQILLDKGCDVDIREEAGWPPLMVAAHDGHLAFVDLLIKNNADIDAEEEEGATSLSIAAQQGHADVVKCLLEAGAKQLPTRPSGVRPIHRAAQNGHLACVKELLKHSPEEIDKCSSSGFTALTFASHKDDSNHLAIMKFLVGSGAKVTVGV